jgi:hypothetical protein
MRSTGAVGARNFTSHRIGGAGDLHHGSDVPDMNIEESSQTN